MSDHEKRMAFARLATAIVTMSARAIDQALDLGEPDLQPKDIQHYTAEARKLLDMIDTVGD